MKLPREILECIFIYLNLNLLAGLGFYNLLRKKYKGNTHTRDWAIKMRYNNFLEWLMLSNLGSFTIYSSSIACISGNLSILKMLYNIDKKYCNYSTYFLAIENGKLDILSWLSTQNLKFCDGECMNLASRNNDVAMLHWLYTNHQKCRECVTYNLDNNYYLITRWLNKKLKPKMIT